MVRSFFPEVETSRGLQNRICMLRAIKVLGENPASRWLVPPYGDVMSGKESFRSLQLLSELGRIEDDRDLRTVALRICKQKPSVAQAIQLAKAHRLGTSKGNAVLLAVTIIRCIERYFVSHPQTTLQQVRGALASAADESVRCLDRINDKDGARAG